MPAVALAVLCSCGGPAPAASGDAGATPTVMEAADEIASSAAPRASASALVKGQKVDLAGGAFASGSTPGDRGRNPSLEPALVRVELGPFAMDRYLYPNEPGKPPLTGVGRARAEQLCAERSGRLCTELEWEYACKGPQNDAFSGSAGWDAACAREPERCASGYGLLGMGAALREWTASDVVAIDEIVQAGAAVRGSRHDGPAVDHRCARRASALPEATGDDIGFRCCYGAKNAATIAAPPRLELHKRANVTPAEIAELVKAVPHLAELAGEPLTFFVEPDDPKLTLQKADAGAPPPNTTLTTSPLWWSPVPGEELLVVAARAGKNSVLLAFHKLPDGRLRIASSMVLRGERGPIALGTNPGVKRRIPWGICWECGGESGTFSFREDHRVVITQK